MRQFYSILSSQNGLEGGRFWGVPSALLNWTTCSPLCVHKGCLEHLFLSPMPNPNSFMT